MSDTDDLLACYWFNHVGNRRRACGAQEALAKKGLIAPFCLARTEQGHVVVPVTNCSVKPVVPLARFVVAVLEAVASANVVGALGSSDVGTDGSLSQTVFLDRSTMEAMISECFESSHQEDLISLLRNFSSLFDIDGCALGVAWSVNHSIDTADSQPLRQKPYRVSLSEREMIQEEVDKMLSRGIVQHSRVRGPPPLYWSPRRIE